MDQAEHQLVVDAPIARVFAVISDYARYAEFLPELRGVDVQKGDDGVAHVRFDVQLIVRVVYTLRVIEDYPSRISWSLAEAKMIEENSGFWLLEDLDEVQTRVTYNLRVKLGGRIPASVSMRLLGDDLPKMLQRFAERAQSESPKDSPPKRRVS